MAKNSSIEWTHHTFNPWWGCTNVSPACKNCYAHTWAHRLGMDNLWGAKGSRRFMSDAHWKEPIRWNKEAHNDGVRRRVFCASMADVFERRAELRVHRERLYRLIDDTPCLDWLMLTKRIQHVNSMVPWKFSFPENVWIGATVEDQRRANDRMDLLLSIPAKIRFLSCEPLLGPVDLEPWISEIDWVIAGGESGHGSRPMNPDWPRLLRDQCFENDVAFHFKQWGNWFPAGAESEVKVKKTILAGRSRMINVGKKKAGRLLDGIEWNQIPVNLV